MEAVYYDTQSWEWDSKEKLLTDCFATGGTTIAALCKLCLISAFLLHPAGVPQHLFPSSWGPRSIRFHSVGFPLNLQGAHHPRPPAVL